VSRGRSGRKVPPVVWFDAVALAHGSNWSSWTGSVVHAKRYGTIFTVCGLDASNFVKRWESPFRPFSVRACRTCSESVQRSALERLSSRSNG
jgi:hypothetical protein